MEEYISEVTLTSPLAGDLSREQRTTAVVIEKCAMKDGGLGKAPGRKSSEQLHGKGRK